MKYIPSSFFLFFFQKDTGSRLRRCVREKARSVPLFRAALTGVERAVDGIFTPDVERVVPLDETGVERDGQGRVRDGYVVRSVAIHGILVAGLNFGAASALFGIDKCTKFKSIRKGGGRGVNRTTFRRFAAYDLRVV